MARKDKRGLGRGLSALMADVHLESSIDTRSDQAVPSDQFLPIEKISPNPDQPRRSFAPEALNELAGSIKEKGVLQPLIVRKAKTTDMYEIVAGERRWRASQKAGLTQLPVIIRELDDREVLEIAIIENIQRADLNPVEEAMGYRQLMDHFGHTQEKLAEALGKSRSYIANLLRLLHLPDEVIAYLQERKLTVGHARALIPTQDPAALARKVISEDLSVREIERFVKGDEAPKKDKPLKNKEKCEDIRLLESDLMASLEMKVSIEHSPDTLKGRVYVAYDSLEELDKLCRLLTG